MKAVIILIYLAFTCLLSQAQYNHYFGNIHAHSDYSDGNKDLLDSINTPAECYNYAKESLNFNFLGISEHNHSEAKGRSGTHNPDDVTITPTLFRQGLDDAISTTVDGGFVALYGLEYGIMNTGGHVLIYGIDSLINWEPGNNEIFNEQENYTSLFNNIAASNGFAYLAHPEKGDYNDLKNQPYNEIFDKAIIGVALRSGPAFEDGSTYSRKPSKSYESRYFEYLGKGYHLAPGADHDNHYTNFGRTTQTRLVVLADSLTKNGIFNAFMNRRFYASDDWNAKVEFTCMDVHPMGSIIKDTINPKFEFSISDDATDAINKVFIYKGVAGKNKNPKRIKTINGLIGFTVDFEQDGNEGECYYFLKIFQEDGDVIWTAPIWYTKN